MTKLAIFDLDNTLLNGDSDVAWGEYLIELGVRDDQIYRQTNLKFYQDYLDGCLDIRAFQRFQLKVLTEYPLETLLQWRQDFMDKKVAPLMLPKAQALIEEHRQNNAHLLIITATNRFITQPIAEKFGISDLIATEPEMKNGCYTGDIIDEPSYAQGKVLRLEKWLKERNLALEKIETWFYSDSHNDLPLLRKVTHPIAVDADATLRAEAERQNWSIISLR
jgi:HAD superfamily hydrolase (TIGR01490 family)